MGKTQAEKTGILYIIICFITFIGILVYSFSATAAVSAEELEGYEVNFSSPEYEKEREIVYQYHLNDPWEDTKFLEKNL